MKRDLFIFVSHQRLERAVSWVLTDIQLEAGIEYGDCTPEEWLSVLAEAGAELRRSLLQLIDLGGSSVAGKPQ